MKNIFLLPTDKPTKLHFDRSGLFESPDYYLSKNINSSVEGRNIYITNNGEIGNGWSYDRMMKSINKMDNVYSSKIILTTDKELIDDGVQAIEDEFFNWFIQNPSCEEIVIEKEYNQEKNSCKNKCETNNCHSFFECKYVDENDISKTYKIIIPKEDLGYITKNGIVVTDEVVKKVMIPKEHFGQDIDKNLFKNNSKEEALCEYCGSTTTCCDDIEAETCDNMSIGEDVSNGKMNNKIISNDVKKIYLFSFTHDIENELPICYQLVYAENETEALTNLKNHFSNQIYNIENCTI